MKLPSDYEYQTEASLVLPYHRKLGCFDDLFLVRLYRATKDGDLERVFPYVSKLNLNQWVGYMEKQALVIYYSKQLEEVIGYGWITDEERSDNGRRAAFGFGFFKKYRRRAEIVDLCWMSLAWWFKELDIRALYGTTLKTNKMAQNFSLRYGFRKVGDLPLFFAMGGQLTDATLIVLERNDFLPRYQQWRETRVPVLTEPGNGR